MRPSVKALENAPDASGKLETRNAVLAFIHAEPHDREREGKVVTRAIKHIKWLAGKFESRRAVLHYFAHLGKETAPPEDARRMVEAMRGRLENAGYEVLVTPFGYFTEFSIHVAGDSLAKVYVEY